MTKHKFLDALKQSLKQLPKEEVTKQCDYYSELLDDMKEDGMTEEEAVEQLGSIDDISQNIIQEMPLSYLVSSRMKPKNGWSVFTIIMVVLASPIWLSIVLAGCAIALSVYIVIWAVIISLFSAVLAIGLGGIAFVVWAFMNLENQIALALMLLGGGFGCFGLSIFAYFGALAAAKALIRLTVLFAKWVKSLFIRKEQSK